MVLDVFVQGCDDSLSCQYSVLVNSIAKYEEVGME